MKGMFVKLALIAGLIFSGAVYAQDKGTADEATTMAKKAITAIKADRDKAYAAINDKNDKDFHNKDLYVFVAKASDGTLVAHGANTGLIGKDLSALKDVDGKLFLAEMTKLANEKGSGWVDYKWTNPVSKKIEQKSTYVEKSGDVYVGVGIYK